MTKEKQRDPLNVTNMTTFHGLSGMSDLDGCVLDWRTLLSAHELDGHQLQEINVTNPSYLAVVAQVLPPPSPRRALISVHAGHTAVCKLAPSTASWPHARHRVSGAMTGIDHPPPSVAPFPWGTELRLLRIKPPTHPYTPASHLPGPRLSGDRDLYRGVGGSEAKKNLFTQNRPPMSGPFDEFLFFFMKKSFLRWMGGWVGQVEEPRLRKDLLRPPPHNSKP